MSDRFGANVVQHSLGRWEPQSDVAELRRSWIGKIPSHWQVIPLKRIAAFVSRGDGPDYVDESSVPVVNQACIHWDGLRSQNFKYQRECDVSGWKGRLRIGDLLINSTGTGTLGRALVFRESGMFLADSHVTIVRFEPGKAHPHFIKYLVQTPMYQGYIYAALVAGSTNQIELSREGLRCTPCVVPPIEEQQNIAAFLDDEMVKLDALVAKKERLIGLLEEKRAALINGSVSRGLNPTFPMKDPGIWWLGRIPRHWQVKRLKYMVRGGLVNGVFKTKEHFGEGVKLINVVDIYQKDSRVDFEQLERVVLSPSEVRVYAVEPGDIFFVRSSLKLEGVAASALIDGVPEPAVFECHLVKIRPVVPQIRPRFMAYYLNSTTVRHRLVSLAQTTTMTTIGQGELAGLEVTLPPMEEQVRVCEFLEGACGRLDAIIAKTREQIAKLQEYRTALISAAVTGGIDVGGSPA